MASLRSFWIPWRTVGWLTASALAAGGCVHVAFVEPAAERSPSTRLERRMEAPDLRAALAEVGVPPPSAGEKWSFEALCWVAFHERADLAAARAHWSLAVAESQGAAERPNPTVSVNPGYNSSVSSPSPWFPSIDFDLPLTGRGKRAADRRRAVQSAEARRQAVVAAAWRVRRELWSALVDWSGAVRRAEASRELAAADARVAAWWSTRVEVGETAAGESGPAGARLAAARSAEEASSAAQAVATARQAVAAALGLPVGGLDGAVLPDVVAEAGALPGDAAAWREAALQERADVRVALADYAAAQATVEREVARQYPDLHLGPGYQWDQGASKWSLVASMEWPVFSRNRAAIDAAVAQRELAAAQLESVQSAVLAELEHATAAMAAAEAWTRSAAATRAAERAEVARARARWEGGEADRLEWALAEREAAVGVLSQVEVDLARARARGELAAAVQQPFAAEASLIATNNVERESR